jgi:LacI family transcriptional regulator
MVVTLNDVARAAKVSKTAVSAVIGEFGTNSRVRVGDQTRQRIIEAAGKLGYTRNILASGLRKGKTHTIGLVLEVLLAEANAIKAQAIEDTAREGGYRTFTCCHYNRRDLEEADLRDLVGRKVDGLAIYVRQPAMEEKNTYLQSLAEQKFPIVTFYGDLPFPVNSVKVDNFYGGLMAIRHMVQIGRTKIAFFSGNPAYSSARDRINGWKEGCKEAGLHFKKMPFQSFSHALEEEMVGYQFCQDLIKSKKEFNALVAGNDFLALGAMKALAERGIKVPDDVAVIGFDDSRFSSFLPVPLTTIHQPSREVGETAFQILLRKMEDPKSPMEQVVLKPSLILRQSTQVNVKVKGSEGIS